MTAPDLPFAYVVYDTETQSYFKTDNGKMIWRMSGHAKNAWHLHFYKHKGSFDDQSRYVVKKCKLVLVEE